jgi:hypothetical protein
MIQRNTLQNVGMGGGHNYRWGDSVVMRFLPTIGTQAPSVAWLQTGETSLRHGSCQVIAATLGKF